MSRGTPANPRQASTESDHTNLTPTNKIEHDMADAAHAPTASEYIVHHLTHFNSSGHPQEKVVDFSIINLDTVFCEDIPRTGKFHGGACAVSGDLAAHEINLLLEIIKSCHTMRETVALNGEGTCCDFHAVNFTYPSPLR